MKKKVLPVIILTYKALQNALKCDNPVLYIDEELYRTDKKRIHQATKEQGYLLSDIPAQKGVFFAKGVDLRKCEINDPYNIL